MCAHGHECCSTGCGCCMELKREQLYDTIFHKVRDGIQRITVVERYFYANSHEKYPVHYFFKNAKGELSEKWYRADLETYFRYRMENSFGRYPKEAEKKYLNTNQVLVVDTSGDYHLLDLEGKELPMTFHSKREVSKGIYICGIIVNNRRIYGFSDEQGNKIGFLNYSKILPFDENGIAIAQNIFGKYGLVNCEGQVVLPFLYDDLNKLSEDRYLVFEDGKKIIIDGTGKRIGKQSYLFVNVYSEGLAFARKDEKNFYYLDLDGKEAIKINGEWGYDFQDGMAAVLKDKKWGYIDKTGRLVIDYQFDRALNFHDGVAPVAIGTNSNTDQWQLIDRNGKFISNKTYDEIERFKNGLSRAHINGKGYGMINTKGKEIFTCNYDFNGYGSANDWFINDRMIRRTIGKENSLELIDRNGEQVLSLTKYTGANFIQDPKKPNSFHLYILVYKKDGFLNLLDFNGNEILKRDYKQVHVFQDGIAIGSIDQKLYLLDLETGEELKELANEQWLSIEDGIIQIENKDKPHTYKYLDMKGEQISVFGVYD